MSPFWVVRNKGASKCSKPSINVAVWLVKPRESLTETQVWGEKTEKIQTLRDRSNSDGQALEASRRCRWKERRGATASRVGPRMRRHKLGGEPSYLREEPIFECWVAGAGMRTHACLSHCVRQVCDTILHAVPISLPSCWAPPLPWV